MDKSAISSTVLNCISLSEPDIHKSVAVLKQVNYYFIFINVFVNSVLVIAQMVKSEAGFVL
jgi:hypothetical protein